MSYKCRQLYKEKSLKSKELLKELISSLQNVIRDMDSTSSYDDDYDDIDLSCDFEQVNEIIKNIDFMEEEYDRICELYDSELDSQCNDYS